MNLKEEILEVQSKEQVAEVLTWIGSNKKRFLELFDLFAKGDDEQSRKASWPLSYAAIDHPEWTKEICGQLIKRLEEENLHNGIKRNGTKVLAEIAIPEEHHGDAMNLCFAFAEDANEHVAVRCNALSVLGNLAVHYPEIKNEIIILIDETISQGTTAAFSARAKMVKKQLSKVAAP